MITVIKTKKSITITGHANFDDYGKDIVCASVSSILLTSVNDMMCVDKESISYEDNGNEVIVKILKNNEIVSKLFNNLILLLESLSKDYPKNIKIESRD